jgi:hypothetical protein
LIGPARLIWGDTCKSPSLIGDMGTKPIYLPCPSY